MIRTIVLKQSQIVCRLKNQGQKWRGKMWRRDLFEGDMERGKGPAGLDGSSPANHSPLSFSSPN